MATYRRTPGAMIETPKPWILSLTKPRRAAFMVAVGTILWGSGIVFASLVFAWLRGEVVYLGLLITVRLGGGAFWGLAMWFIVERKLARLNSSGRV
jgi:hypothetical protein